jgi:hypothetical protein
MRPPLRSAQLPLVPAEVAGLVLVVLAAALLAGGLGPGAAVVPTGAWVFVTGLVVLLGAALATVLIGSSLAPGPMPSALQSRRPAETLGSPSVVSPEGPAEELRTSAPRRGLLTPPRPISTSIPGAYLAAVDAPATEFPAWEPSPPIAAALPLAALPRAPGPREGPAEESSVVLEVELARLRARLLEIEGETGRRPLVARLDVSGGSRTIPTGPSTAPGERPGPGWSVPRGSCAACGRTVASIPAPALCVSCGRVLCAECAGHGAGSNGLLHCPDCASGRAPSTISGGRAAPPVRTGDADPTGGEARPGPYG